MAKAKGRFFWGILAAGFVLAGCPNNAIIAGHILSEGGGIALAAIQLPTQAKPRTAAR